jgi:hypothetical protein
MIKSVINRNDKSVVEINGFDRKFILDERIIYINGYITGIINDDYTISPCNRIDRIFDKIPDILSRLCGEYSIVSMLDGKLEFITNDFMGVSEIYYVNIDDKIILGNSFFDIAESMNRLNFDIYNLKFFISNGYCNSGKTIFKDVYRIPPGNMLILGSDGKIKLNNYLDLFKNNCKINYTIFRDALNSAIIHKMIGSKFKRNAVLLSGGVDSSVLLGALKNFDTDNNVRAITFKINPCNSFNASDFVRSEKIAKRLDVEHEFIDIDLNSLNCNYLNNIIIQMPFAAHLSIDFLELFQQLEYKNTLSWCGQNCDTLYNLGATDRYAFIHRFLISQNYIKSMQGVQNYKKYNIIQQIIDPIIKMYYNFHYGEKIYTAKNIYELIEYFSQSPSYLAVSPHSFNQYSRGSTLETISVDTACKILFDEKLGSFFTGRDNKVLVHSSRLFNCSVIMPYSMGNMIILFRNLRKGFKDVIIPKQYIYQYARKELNLKRDYFYNSNKIDIPYLELPEWERDILNCTGFGKDLKKIALETKNVLGIQDPTTGLQNILSLYWINGIVKELENRGVIIT